MKIKVFACILLLSSKASFTSGQQAKEKQENNSKSAVGSFYISKENFLKTERLENIIPRFPVHEATISSAKITIVQRGKNLIEIGSKGEITEHVKKVIKEANQGTELYIEYIKTKSKSGSSDASTFFPPIAFILTNP